MALPNNLTKETRAVIASNFTVAVAILTVAGREEKEAKKLVNKWYEELYVPDPAGKPLFPELSE
jgi:hypothetical protein